MTDSLMMALLLALTNLPSAALAGDHAGDGSALAGEWIGKKDSSPVGAYAGGDLGVPVRLTLKVGDGGGLSGVVETGPDYSVMDSRWRATFTPPNKVEAVMTVLASCNGERREYEVRLRGKVKAEGGRTELVVEGKNSPCLAAGGYFRTKYTFERAN